MPYVLFVCMMYAFYMHAIIIMQACIHLHAHTDPQTHYYTTLHCTLHCRAEARSTHKNSQTYTHKSHRTTLQCTGTHSHMHTSAPHALTRHMHTHIRRTYCAARIISVHMHSESGIRSSCSHPCAYARTHIRDKQETNEHTSTQEQQTCLYNWPKRSTYNWQVKLVGQPMSNFGVS